MERFGNTKAFSPDCPAEFQESLQNMYMLYGLWLIEKNMGTFYQGKVYSINYIYLINIHFFQSIDWQF